MQQQKHRIRNINDERGFFHMFTKSQFIGPVLFESSEIEIK